MSNRLISVGFILATGVAALWGLRRLFGLPH